MLFYTNSNTLMYFVFPYMRIRLKIEGIEGNRSLGAGKLAEIRRRSHWPSFLPTSPRVRSGFSGLSCSRLGSIFWIFFQIFSPPPHTDEKVN